MSKLAQLLLRGLGLLILVAALLAGASKAPDRSLESLVARWAPPPSEFIEVQGQLLHYRDEGQASDPSPILLLHGTSSSLHTWEGWVAGLKDRHRVITVDLPGFGLSGPSPSGDYSEAAYLGTLRALLDRLKLKQVIIGGNSLGGEIAWQLAAQAPERVKALILVDASGYALQPEQVPIAWRLLSLPLIGPVFEHLLPRYLVQHSLRQVYGHPERVDAALIDRYFELTLRAGNRTALRRRLGQLRLGEFADRIPGLRLPTLILWGQQDRLVPPAAGEAFARDIPGSRLVRFADLGHVPQEEDPKASLAPVLDFLHTLKP